ncbi:hypothetical protein Nepgr_028406 [Nepenthes gracilis]|uniref:Uncharacterized protein n=1 Tax=Nepenthes gracilis TaxID=150966 RepID=A0AAD3Y2D7_NEPGR|nr:hypothetical protein Nepgr_028406 [Nepenthes gracilis]
MPRLLSTVSPSPRAMEAMPGGLVASSGVKDADRTNKSHPYASPVTSARNASLFGAVMATGQDRRTLIEELEDSIAIEGDISIDLSGRWPSITISDDFREKLAKD